MVRKLQSVRKTGKRSYSSTSYKSIRKTDTKQNVIKDQIAENDIIVFIPYRTDQINDLNRKVPHAYQSIQEQSKKMVMPFLMEFEDETGGFKSALKVGADDCFLFENTSVDFDTIKYGFV
ncbi:6587_t:CDS:2 [Funneliformis caledonium]|uniref:6587_t:CDS:1 n=1 Tax=Funneliformis caledonium TaxID=1117310 RepID=A0A9N8V3H3_9GLOM|nr:6587_t:CDS:2 [Funneliformis caledonium]